MSGSHHPSPMGRNDQPQISFHDLDSSSAVIVCGSGDALLPIFSLSVDQSSTSHNECSSNSNFINTTNTILFNSNSKNFLHDEAIGIDPTVADDFGCSTIAAHETASKRTEDVIENKLRSNKRTFECKKCDRTFIRRSSLIIHQRIHNEESPYQCIICGRLFRQKSNANRHIETHKIFPKFHQQVNSHNLSQGPIISGCKSGKQMRKETSVMVAYQCSYCEYQFDCARCLKSHAITTHQGIKVYGCPAETCQVESADLLEIVEHITDMHKTDYIYKCYLCDQSFRRLTSIEAHFLSHRSKKHFNYSRSRIKKDDQISCPVCPKKYSTLYVWKRHYFSIHGASKKKWECVECSRKFSYEMTYKAHMKRHNKENLKVICEKCSKSFSRLDALKRHSQSRHIDANTSLTITAAYRCSFQGCTKIYKRQDSLRDHLKCHHQANDKNSIAFECNECGRSFSRQRALRAHIETKHERKHKYECNVCGKGYERSYLLDKHVHKCLKRVKGS